MTKQFITLICTFYRSNISNESNYFLSTEIYDPLFEFILKYRIYQSCKSFPKFGKFEKKSTVKVFEYVYFSKNIQIRIPNIFLPIYSNTYLEYKMVQFFTRLSLT